MKENHYTRVPEIDHFFEIKENESGEFVSGTNSPYNLTVHDLKEAALIVSKSWVSEDSISDEDIRKLLEVIHGTIVELEFMHNGTISHLHREKDCY